MSILLKCGHSANAKRMLPDGSSIPTCVICNCTEIEDAKPDLTGRKAKCSDCGRTTDSKYELAFFKHTPDSKYDEYYCGCYGWD